VSHFPGTRLPAAGREASQRAPRRNANPARSGALPTAPPKALRNPASAQNHRRPLIIFRPSGVFRYCLIAKKGYSMCDCALTAGGSLNDR
jgi:hypothetical protein